eukprot:377125-Pleurochrysis_carterae.AAC.1
MHVETHAESDFKVIPSRFQAAFNALSNHFQGTFKPLPRSVPYHSRATLRRPTTGATDPSSTVSRTPRAQSVAQLGPFLSIAARRCSATPSTATAAWLPGGTGGRSWT